MSSALTQPQQDRVREFYTEWMNGLGIPSIPETLVKFVTECQMPKDMRIAVVVAWLTKNSEVVRLVVFSERKRVGGVTRRERDEHGERVG